MAEIPKSWVVYGAAGLVALMFVTGLVVVFTIRPPEGPPAQPTDPARGFAFPDAGAKTPGERILQGADQAFLTGYYPTALKFYKDFELRYAGSDAYDAQAPRIWDRMIECDRRSPEKDSTLKEYVAARKGLTDEWNLLKSRPRPESKVELQAFAAKLPPEDGRRSILEGWLVLPPGPK